MAGLQIMKKKKDPDDICLPDPLLFVQPGGKPFFRDDPDVHFSLSHSGAYMACAFSDQPVGLDLQEHIVPHTGPLRIARRFFTGQEYSILSALDSPQEQKALFFNLWSIKEAYLKYIGCGLRGGMDSFLPDPLPSLSDYTARQSGCQSSSLHTPDESGKAMPSAVFSNSPSPVPPITQGKIRVLKDHDLLSSAEYGLLPAPDRYVLAVCAQTLPAGIIVEWI